MAFAETSIHLLKALPAVSPAFVPLAL